MKQKRITALVQTKAGQQEKHVVQRAASMAEACLITDLQHLPGMPPEERKAWISFIQAMHNLAGGVQISEDESMRWIIGEASAGQHAQATPEPLPDGGLLQ